MKRSRRRESPCDLKIGDLVVSADLRLLGTGSHKADCNCLYKTGYRKKPLRRDNSRG
jgi:hypothetical protein